MSEMGFKVKLWRVVRFLCTNNSSYIFLEGKSFEFFPLMEGECSRLYFIVVVHIVFDLRT